MAACARSSATINELGYLPFSPLGGALWFHWPSTLCERTSAVIPTHLTFAEWPSVFGDAKMATALLDRLAHHGPVVEAGKEPCRFRHSAETAKARIQEREKAQRGTIEEEIPKPIERQN
jgi:DNA replication protein DnaC